MGEERLLEGGGVFILQRVDDASVVGQGGSHRLQVTQAVVAIALHEPAQLLAELEEVSAPRGAAEDLVELFVAGHEQPRIAFSEDEFRLLQVLFQGLDGAGGHAGQGPAAGQALVYPADGEDLLQLFPVEFTHTVTDSGDRLEEAVLFKEVQSLAYRGAGDADFLGDLRFDEAPRGFQLMAQDAFAQVLVDRFADWRRLGDDEDLKGAVLLFATQAGKHITGQTLAVDGGVSIVTGG